MAGALRSVVLNLDGLLRSDGLGGADDSLSKYLSDHIQYYLCNGIPTWNGIYIHGV